MAKQGKPLSKVLDWEALASAPNTHGAFSFLNDCGRSNQYSRLAVPQTFRSRND